MKKKLTKTKTRNTSENRNENRIERIYHRYQQMANIGGWDAAYSNLNTHIHIHIDIHMQLTNLQHCYIAFEANWLRAMYLYLCLYCAQRSERDSVYGDMCMHKHSRARTLWLYTLEMRLSAFERTSTWTEESERKREKNTYAKTLK